MRPGIARQPVDAPRDPLDISLLGELDQADLMQPGRSGLSGGEVPGLILRDPESTVSHWRLFMVSFGGNNITSWTIIASRAKPAVPREPAAGTAFHSRNVTVFVTLRNATCSAGARVYATPTSGARWL